MARRDLHVSAASGQGLQQSAQAFGQHVFHRQLRLALNNQRDVLERTLQQSLQRVGHACKAVHGRPWRLLRVLMAQAETPVQG